MNKWCADEQREATIDCWVRDHFVVESTLYVDGSWTFTRAEPLTQMTYTGTPESRNEIQDWMTASALNPETPFGYQPGMVLEDGRPGFVLRPGMTVYRDSTGKFAAK